MSKYNIWTFFLCYNRRKCKMRRNGCIAAEQKHYFWSNCFCSFLTSMPGVILDFVYTTWSNANNWTVQNNAKNSYISSITSKSKDMISKYLYTCKYISTKVFVIRSNIFQPLRVIHKWRHLREGEKGYIK